MERVTNASYDVCIYNQNDVAIQCLAGKYVGDGKYSSTFLVNSRFQPGIYRVEGTLYGVLQNGSFIIVEEKVMTIRALPVIPLILLALLILAVGILLNMRRVRVSRKRIRRRRRKVVAARRQSQSRRLVRVRKRA